eukprot:EG_transcript_49185
MVPSFTQASMSKEPPTPNPDIDPSHTKGFFFVGAVVGGEPASFFQIVQIRKKSGISFFCHSQQVRSVFFEENQFGCCPPPKSKCTPLGIVGAYSVGRDAATEAEH